VNFTRTLFAANWRLTNPVRKEFDHERFGLQRFPSG
jgi:hypothetical protein